MNGFDRTPEGEELIAMLKRAAPPRPDARAQAARVLQRVRTPERGGWLGYLVTAGALAAAAAVAVIVFFPPRVEAPDSGPATTGTAATKVEVAAEGINVGVRAIDGELLTLDTGLSRGLRVGDELRAGETVARITAVGIFISQARVEKGKAPAQGDKLVAPMSQAIGREQRFEFIGGDPGALYDFGAVLEALPPQEARVRGISDGKALVVLEALGAILREKGVEPSLAGQLGLQKGDVVLACNGLPASDIAQLVNALEMSRRSGTIRLKVLRGTKEVELASK